MLRAAYAAVKAVRADDTVVMGGLAPFGAGPPSFRRGRVAPVDFARRMLCLTRALRRGRCRAPTPVDVYAIHPYSSAGPTQKALNADDVATPDVGKLERVFAAARRAGTSPPGGRKPIWATEMGWDTRPPNRQGVRPGVQARWLDEAFYLLWRRGVSLALNLQLRDQPVGGRPGETVTRQTGLYFRGATVQADRAKPSLRAFSFPFVAVARGARELAWTVSPCATPCKVVIEKRAGRRWRRVASGTAGRDGVIVRSVRAGRTSVLRARAPAAGLTSRSAVPRAL
jgi:hypothetical protein